jgi:predicted DCC family thiol-disulfide oxidoreductase YuxK
MTPDPIVIYYDGLCPLCSREIAHYRAHVAGSPVAFVDIAAGDFDPNEHGVDLARARQVLHVKVGGQMRTGVDAVISMWEAIPRYRRLAGLARLPGIYLILDVGYRIFARVRPHLQRANCETGSCARS